MHIFGQEAKAEIQTVNELFLRVAGRTGRMRCCSGRCGSLAEHFFGIEVYRRVRALAKALQGWGIQRGDRIALLSENRWEWQVTDFAVLAIGAVDVPIYPTLTSEQIGELLRDSAARIAVVSTRRMYDKVEPIRRRGRPGTCGDDGLGQVPPGCGDVFDADAVAGGERFGGSERTRSSTRGPVRRSRKTWRR
jgi:long-subunit acyl-CoA synthetase (AMP-forming)